MSYEYWELDGLYVVRWGLRPEVSDVAKQADELAAARRRRRGRAVVGLFIMPPESQPPDEAFRKEQATHLPTMFAHMDYAIAVFEGTGFVASLKRSALVAILLLSKQRHSVYVRHSLEDALITHPPRPFDFDGPRALEQLELLLAPSRARAALGA